MDSIVIIIFGVLAVIYQIIYYYRKSKRNADYMYQHQELRKYPKQDPKDPIDIFFHDLGKNLDLEFRKGKMYGTSYLEKEHDTFILKIKKYHDSLYASWFFEVSAHYNSALKEKFEIRYISINLQNNRKMKRTGKYPEILSGDKNFDTVFTGNSEHKSFYHGLLKYKLRNSLLILSNESESVNVSNSSLVVLIPLNPEEKPLISCINMIKNIMNHITNDTSLKEKLIDTIKHDPVPEVKLHNIRALAEEYNTSDTRNIIREAMSDPNISLRIECAKHLGDEGIDYLRDMIQTESKLDTDQLHTIIQILKKTNDREIVKKFRYIYPKSREIVKQRILILFREFSDNEVNEFLLSELSKGNADLNIAIIEALGTCGTVDSIEKLIVWSKEQLNPFMRNTVKQAIEKIQSRLGPAGRGWLSIPEYSEKEGALSIADEASDGALSIVDEESDNKNDDTKE